jgi:chemotaxis protein CheD
MITTRQSFVVGLGELIVTKDPTVTLTCMGLGSCIALCIHDPVSRIGGMAHLMLPNGKITDNMSSPSKYVDSGTVVLIQKMIKQGATKNNMIVKLAGGARMLSIPGDISHLDIGNRNIVEVKAVLGRENLRIRGIDVGGSFGRTVHLHMDTGKVIVKAVNGQITEL